MKQPWLLLVTLLALSGSAGGKLPPLVPVAQPVDIERYLGQWYVQASIPVKIPFFNDAAAFNYIEQYELLPDGSIRLDCAFNDGGYDGQVVSTTFKAVLADADSNASWHVRPVWPLKLNYLIIHLAEDYQSTIVGVPNRRWAWIMTREAHIPESTYQELLGVVKNLGYDLARFRRIPHAI